MSDETTELREKLTERGIEYTTNDHMGVCETSWNGFTAMQLTPGAKLMMAFTPDQAIAATLDAPINEATGKPFDFNKLADRLDKDATFGSGKPFSDAIANLRKTVR